MNLQAIARLVQWLGVLSLAVAGFWCGQEWKDAQWRAADGQRLADAAMAADGQRSANNAAETDRGKRIAATELQLAADLPVVAAACVRLPQPRPGVPARVPADGAARVPGGPGVADSPGGADAAAGAIAANYAVGARNTERAASCRAWVLAHGGGRP